MDKTDPRTDSPARLYRLPQRQSTFPVSWSIGKGPGHSESPAALTSFLAQDKNDLRNSILGMRQELRTLPRTRTHELGLQRATHHPWVVKTRSQLLRSSSRTPPLQDEAPKNEWVSLGIPTVHKIPDPFRDVDGLGFSQKDQILEGIWPMKVDYAKFLGKKREDILRVYPSLGAPDAGFPRTHGGKPSVRQPTCLSKARCRPCRIQEPTYASILYWELCRFLMEKVVEFSGKSIEKFGAAEFRQLDEYVTSDNKVSQMMLPAPAKGVSFRVTHKPQEMQSPKRFQEVYPSDARPTRSSCLVCPVVLGRPHPPVPRLTLRYSREKVLKRPTKLLPLVEISRQTPEMLIASRKWPGLTTPPAGRVLHPWGHINLPQTPAGPSRLFRSSRGGDSGAQPSQTLPRTSKASKL